MSAIKKFYYLRMSLCLAILSLAVVSATAGDGIVSFKHWNTIGPSGGDVRAIEIDPKNENHLFITTMDGQIYASYDAGSSWELLANLNEPQLVLDNLIVDIRDSNILYVSGHRHKGRGGFFKTTDGGRTWNAAKELKNEAIHAMVQSSLDPNMLLVGTVTGVWVSRDSGDSWTKFTSNTAPKKLDALAIDPRDMQTIYAGTWWRAYKSTDGGNSWRLIKNGMIDDSDVFAIDLNPRNPDHIIASACSGIYESYNGGEKWKKIQGIPSQSRRTRDIVQHPSKAGVVYAGTTEGFWMTTNGGRSWRVTTARDLDINAIAVHPNKPNRVFIATNNNGVMVSYNGGRTFGSSNGNFSSRFTYKVFSDAVLKNRLYAVTINTANGGGFVFTSDDSGRTWKKSVKNFNTNRTVAYTMVQDRITPNTIYLGTNRGIYRSLNRGVSWQRVKARKRVVRRRSRRSRRRRRASRSKLAAGEVASLTGKINVLTHTADAKNGYFAGTNNGLYVSYDISKSWKRIRLGKGIDQRVYAVHVSPKLPNVIWIGTATSGVLMSNDAGATWTKMSGIPAAYPISAINSDPERPERVFVGTIFTLYMTEDLGKTWVRRGGNLPLGNFNSILINPANTKEMYVASALKSDGGIFFSQDGGRRWTRIDSKRYKLASRRVWSLIFDPEDPSRLLASTHSSGIYKIGRTESRPLAASAKGKAGGLDSDSRESKSSNN